MEMQEVTEDSYTENDLFLTVTMASGSAILIL